MATRGSKKSAAESEDEETKTIIPKSMEILVTDFSKAIQTAMTAVFSAATAATTAAITAHHSAATTTKYTFAIDPYDNQSFSVDTK